MKAVLLVLLLGTVAGIAAHAGWFALRRPVTASGPGAALSWMQSDLHLTPEQFARIKAIHARSGPKLQELGVQAARMRAELEHFEQVRRTLGEVDFLQFARYVQERRSVDRLCAESTHRLIAATLVELTPAQRDRYLSLMNTAVPAAVN